MGKRFLITGGSGFIGIPLVNRLLEQGDQITILTRNPNSTSAKFNGEVTTIDDTTSLDSTAVFDVLINLAGAGIGDKRWSSQVKQELHDSRIITTRNLVNFMRRAEHKPELFISGSAIGYYGLCGDQIIDETGQGDDSFTSQLCQAWEAEASIANQLGVNTVLLRTGIVLGDGGALAKMLLPFKLGIGGKLGNGKQWFSWIHIADLVGIICYLIDNPSTTGPVNGTAPDPVTNYTFTKVLGKVLGKPTFLPIPGFAIRLLFGDMGYELLLSGQRVIPTAIQKAGYEFQYTDLEKALNNVIYSTK